MYRVHSIRCIFHVILNQIFKFKVIHNISAMHLSMHIPFLYHNRLDFQSTLIFFCTCSPLEWLNGTIRSIKDRETERKTVKRTTTKKNLQNKVWNFSVSFGEKNFRIEWKFNQFCSSVLLECYSNNKKAPHLNEIWVANICMLLDVTWWSFDYKIPPNLINGAANTTHTTNHQKKN